MFGDHDLGATTLAGVAVAGNYLVPSIRVIHVQVAHELEKNKKQPLSVNQKLYWDKKSS
jgi:1-aminocyclopropane-1-carboxylate deaminase/D-cysteine desulfhydrase-like pyridoxal-dependent ACC family enzyme